MEEGLRILENKAECLICGDVVQSYSRHHSRTCSCGNLTVDGGTDYLRRTYKRKYKWKELSVYSTLSQ